MEGRQGTGQDTPQTLQPFSLLLFSGAGEDEFPLRSDDGESNLPAVPSDALGQVFPYFIPLLIASQKNLALLKSIQGVLIIQQPPLLRIQGKPPFLEGFSMLWTSLLHEALFEVVPGDERHEL